MSSKSASILSLSEASLNGEGFIEGVDNAISVIGEQSEICKQYSSAPVFPTFGQKLAISKGIYDGMPVDAVRYASPSHMTGWYLTTDLYDGDVKTMEVVYYHDVVFKRPDLRPYLALPPGFRFNASDDVDIWFDESVSRVH